MNPVAPPPAGPPPAAACVIAVTATYRRPAELQRLILSLENSRHPLHALLVVDNADDPSTRALAAPRPLRIEMLSPGRNLGCGGGLAAGEQFALEKFGSELTHLWILDDDAVIFPETLGTLLETMASQGAEAAHPLVIDAAGRLGWFPGLLDREKFRIIQQPQTPGEFFTRCGSAPIPFSWAQGIALLVTRKALTELGFHRTDYWVRGEDLEFSLRITHRYPGLYVPEARVLHLPPEPTDAPPREVEYLKHRAMLQNIAYTALRLPHGRRIARTIPGNWLRFLCTWGWTPRTLLAAAAALCQGALRGHPAGATPARPTDRNR